MDQLVELLEYATIEKRGMAGYEIYRFPNRENIIAVGTSYRAAINNYAAKGTDDCQKMIKSLQEEQAEFHKKYDKLLNWNLDYFQVIKLDKTFGTSYFERPEEYQADCEKDFQNLTQMIVGHNNAVRSD